MTLIELTCFPKATTLRSGSVGALTACQVHQTQLAHIHLVFVLKFNTRFNLKMAGIMSDLDKIWFEKSAK